MIQNPFSLSVAQAMQRPHVNMVLAAEFDFQSGTTRVHTGIGEILIDGQVYTGLGSMGDVGSIKEENSTSATQLQVTLSGLEPQLISIALNEQSVNRKVRVFIATLNEDYTQVSYNLLFKGKLTGASHTFGDTSALNFTVSNIFEEWSKGRPFRYTDESHKKRHPGDRFFRYVAQMAEHSLYWGSKKDGPGFRYD
ncbi:hypothetical protein [Salmonella phage PMBT28]|nr:hypothetical protein [Salmonella phage PMBT28]